MSARPDGPVAPGVPSPPRRRRGRAVVVAAGLLLAAGCAKAGETTSTSPGAPAGSGATSAPDDRLGSGLGAATSGTEPRTPVPVGGTVTYLGYRITVADGSFDDTRDELRIPLDVENLGREETTFYGESIALDTGAAEAISGSVTAPPPIAPGATTKAVVVFYLADGLTMIGDSTALVFGTAEQQQARVPLGGAGSAVTRDPLEQATPPEVVVGTVTIAPVGLELRYDDVVQHTQADAGTAYLVLHARATSSATDQTFYVGTDQATLALPDGTSGAADAFTSEADAIEPGATTDVWLRWTVPDTLTGAVTITFAADWGPDAAPATAPMPITVTATS